MADWVGYYNGVSDHDLDNVVCLPMDSRSGDKIADDGSALVADTMLHST